LERVRTEVKDDYILVKVRNPKVLKFCEYVLDKIRDNEISHSLTLVDPTNNNNQIVLVFTREGLDKLLRDIGKNMKNMHWVDFAISRKELVR